MNDELREKIMKVYDWTKRFVHVGFIPLILVLGFTRSIPRPSILKLISPLANSIKEDAPYGRVTEERTSSSSLSQFKQKSWQFMDIYGENGFDPANHAQITLSKGIDPVIAANKLVHDIDTVNQLISQQVLGQYSRLIAQVHELEFLSTSLTEVKLDINGVKSRQERLKKSFVPAYTEYEKDTVALKRAHQVWSVVAVIERVLLIVSKMKSVSSNEGHLMSRLASLTEYDEISTAYAIEKLSPLKRLDRYMSEERLKMVEFGKQAFQDGLSSKNEGLLQTSFHVLSAFNLWNDQVLTYLKTINQNLAQQTRVLLDPVSITIETKNDDPHAKDTYGGVKRTGGPANGATNVPLWASKLWIRFEKFVDLVSSLATSILFLHQSLKNQCGYRWETRCSELPGKDIELNKSLFPSFWKDLCKTVETEIRTLTKGSQLLLQVMQAGYPRILRIISDGFSRLCLQHPEEFGLQSQYRIGFSKVFVTFESAYVSRSLSRLLEVVNGSLPERQQTTTRLSLDDIEKLCRAVASELEVVSFDFSLRLQVCKNINKAVHMFCMKAEQLTATDRSAFLIGTGSPSSSQLLNLDIVSCLWNLRTSCWKTMSEYLDPPEQESVTDAVLGIARPIEGIMEALLQNLCAELETVVAKVHTDSTANFKSIKSSAHEKSGNSYMPILLDKMKWTIREIFSRVRCGEDSKEWFRVFACRVIEIVARHLSLLKPLDESVRIKIMSDLNQLEIFMSESLGSVGLSLDADIPESFRLLRGFKKLLDAKLDDVASIHDEGLDVRIVAHNLLVRAQPQMVLPLSVYAWTELEYSSWMDGHSYSDHIALLEKCLDLYMGKVASSGQTQFCPEYAVLRSLLQ